MTKICRIYAACGVSQTPKMQGDKEVVRKPGISIKELAEILRIDKSGVSRFIEDLVQKKLWKEIRQ